MGTFNKLIFSQLFWLNVELTIENIREFIFSSCDRHKTIILITLYNFKKWRHSSTQTKKSTWGTFEMISLSNIFKQKWETHPSGCELRCFPETKPSTSSYGPSALAEMFLPADGNNSDECIKLLSADIDVLLTSSCIPTKYQADGSHSVKEHSWKTWEKWRLSAKTQLEKVCTHLVTGDLLILSGSSVTLKKKTNVYVRNQ